MVVIRSCKTPQVRLLLSVRFRHHSANQLTKMRRCHQHISKGLAEWESRPHDATSQVQCHAFRLCSHCWPRCPASLHSPAFGVQCRWVLTCWLCLALLVRCSICTMVVSKAISMSYIVVAIFKCCKLLLERSLAKRGPARHIVGFGSQFIHADQLTFHLTFPFLFPSMLMRNVDRSSYHTFKHGCKTSMLLFASRAVPVERSWRACTTTLRSRCEIFRPKMLALRILLRLPVSMRVSMLRIRHVIYAMIVIYKSSAGIRDL